MRLVLLTLRAGLIVLGIGVAVFLLGLIGYKLAVEPQIIIAAPEGSTISLTNMQSGLKVAQTTISGASATLSTGVGSYKVVVNSKSGSQVFYTQTALLKRISFQFAPPKQLTATQLAQQVAYNAVGDGNNFAYLNTSSQTIEQRSGGAKSILDSFGAGLPRNNTTNAQAMYAIAGNRAIILTHSKLYILQNGHLDPLRIDGFPASVSSLVIGTNAQQSSFAVLANNILYWYQSPSAQPQQVAELTKQADQLAVGGNNVVAYSTRMPNAQEDIRYAYASTYAIDPILVSITSGSQHTFTSGPIVDASVSPDGQYATIEQRGAAHTDIVRLADSITVQSVENADTLTPVWISSTRYVYGKASSVYVFDINTRSAMAIAALPLGQPITSITYNADEQNYLVTTYPSEQGATVYQLQ